MYTVVSSSTPSYYPGIIALWNSIKLNSDKCDLHVYCYDTTDEYKNLEKLGINVILNRELLGPIVQKGEFRGAGTGPVNEDMYARLMVSEDFSGRVFYVDADCVILHPIYELWDDLDLGDNFTACVPRMDIGWIGGNRHDDMASGTFLADTDKWREYRIAQQCFDIMEKVLNKKIPRHFGLNVESVLSYFHNGNFYKLNRAYQNLTYYGKLSKVDKVAHFASYKPWLDRPVNYKQLWQAYYRNDIEQIKLIEESLLEEQYQKIHYKTRESIRNAQLVWS